jgi:CubicO group peptidase (beta-lactamase class C family)
MGAALLHRGEAVVAVTGRRRADRPDPLRSDDAFHLGSDTKAMTASVVARLVDRGLLSFDETLEHALPEIAKEINPAFRAVTIELLLRHLAGLPGGGAFNEEFFRGFDEHWEVMRQRAWVARRFLSRPPHHAPGSKFLYSNYGYIIVGHVLERRSGKPWESLIEEEVFRPLGIQGCGFGPTTTAKTPNGNWAHAVKAGRYEPTEEDNPPLLGPAGTVHCSLAAWSRFAWAHLGGVPGWLSRASLDRLHAPWHGPGLPPEKSVGLGWGVTRVGELRWTHGGSNGFNFAQIVIVPGRDGAVLVTCNAGDARGEKALRAATDLLVDKLPGR